MFRHSGKKTLTGEKKPMPLESMAFVYLGKMFENIKLSVDDMKNLYPYVLMAYLSHVYSAETYTLHSYQHTQI